MITLKELIHIKILSKISNAVNNAKKYNTIDLIIMKNAIDEELIERKYIGR